jgi:hypothetical protein
MTNEALLAASKKNCRAPETLVYEDLGLGVVRNNRFSRDTSK